MFRRHHPQCDQESVEWLNSIDTSRLKKIYLVHGEKDAQEYFTQYLNENGYKNVEVVKYGESYELVQKMNENLSEEIIALQTKLVYLEDYVNKLQEVCVEHTEQIELLRKENKLLSQKVKELSDSVEGDIPNRRPPHYQFNQKLMLKVFVEFSVSKSAKGKVNTALLEESFD